MDGFSFLPAKITVKQGDSVVFRNDDTRVHTATLDSGERDTGGLAPGETRELTMPTMGSHRYHCARHPQMAGTIIVQEP